MFLRALSAATVLLVHTTALAQQPAPQPQPPAPQQPQAPQPEQQPPALPPPPPNYPPPPPPYGPPPGYYGQYGQSYYAPPPPPRGTYRPFTLGFGLGLGSVWFLDQVGDETSEPGLSYTLRFGFGVTRDLIVMFGIDGVVAEHDGPSVSQTGYTMGVQYLLVDRLYLRGGIGLAYGTLTDFHDESGVAFMGAAGYEFTRGYNTSLAVELGAMFGKYPHGEGWTSGGVNFVLSFY